MYSPSPILARLLFFPGLLYEGVVRTRNAAFSAGLLHRYQLPAPVISIGNITLGGTGKTPLVRYVAGALKNMGFPAALLTRGYGRLATNSSIIIAPNSRREISSLNLGDEPALFHRWLPDLWLGVAADRLKAGKEIAARQAGLTFLLDDGFQHRQLHRNLDIVVVDPTQPLASNRIFPGGSLREPLKGLVRSEIIIVNSSLAGPTIAKTEEAIRGIHPTAALFRCFQKIEGAVPYADWKDLGPGRLPAGACGSVFLIAALGNPERFYQDVRHAGFQVAGNQYFRDHHRISPAEWHACAAEAKKIGADALLITEKDAIKLSQPPDFPLLVATQSTSFEDPIAFDKMLRRVIEDAL